MLLSLISPRFSLRTSSSSNRIALSFAAGLRCVYRCVVDRVLPHVPMRQWVLSLPRWARFLLAETRRSSRTSREYRGRRAVILGIIWIVLGAAFELYPGLMR